MQWSHFHDLRKKRQKTENPPGISLVSSLLLPVTHTKKKEVAVSIPTDSSQHASMKHGDCPLRIDAVHCLPHPLPLAPLPSYVPEYVAELNTISETSPWQKDFIYNKIVRQASEII